MNCSSLYLTELRPIEKCVNLQHFVTERGMGLPVGGDSTASKENSDVVEYGQLPSSR